MSYYLCLINGKQYKVTPGIPFLVDRVTSDKVEVKVLSSSLDGKVSLGKPFLKDDLQFKILEETRKSKIRVAKFHAKANYRRVSGLRPKATRIVLD